MKKILFFGALFLSAITFVSCNEDYDDWADPQSNPQEEAVTLPGYTASGVSAIDIATVEGDSVQVLSLSSVSLPEGAVVGNTHVDIVPADGSSTQVTTIAVDNKNRVAVTDLQAAIETYYGKRPIARELTAHVYSDIIINGQSFLVDAGTITITATPEAPFIASAYYIIVGNMTDLFNGTPIQFSHSGEDVYTDPVFTVTFTATADCYWKIIPQNNYDNGDPEHVGVDGVVGVATDGDTSMSGTLTTENPQAGRILNEGLYRMTINMMDYTYTIEQIVTTNYYLVGALQSWDGGAAWDTSDNSCLLYPQSATIYSYTTQWLGDGNFKFWTTVGQWDTAYGTPTENDTSINGTLIGNNDGGQNIKVPTVGEYYTFTIDMGNMTYTWTRCDNQTPQEYETMNISGDFNGWGIGGDGAMKEASPHNWYVHVTIPSDGTLKFRVADDWDEGNWGSSTSVADQYYGTGVSGGDNISIPTGTYDVYFNDITLEYVFVAAE